MRPLRNDDNALYCELAIKMKLKPTLFLNIRYAMDDRLRTRVFETIRRMDQSNPREVITAKVRHNCG